ncbi:MAG: DUF6361 family protein [Phycisphaerales bacterium]
MPSTFSWLDFAESDRQQAMQVIDLFREKSTVDELGFAPIRDAFADHLFPGTSTIQTRARYFLFVPWIMRRYERRSLAAQVLSQKIRGRETKLIKALLAGNADEGGIIGREALGTLKRMPSSVYWRGLHLWGVRLFTGSIEQYCRQIERARRDTRGGVVTDDGEPLGRVSTNWHPTLPGEPEDLYDQATFSLTKNEAEFLKERICSAQPASLLAQVVTKETDELTAGFVWDASIDRHLTSELRGAIEQARRFAICAWGGPLLYSRLVASLKGNDELVNTVTEQLVDWQARMAQEMPALSTWDLEPLWNLVHRANPRVSRRTQDFTEQWIGVALRAGAGAAVWDDLSVQKLVVAREGQLKGGRSRLRPENLRARDRWQGDVDGGPMDFRWGQTRTILNDILRGLHGGAANGGGGDA